MTFFFSELNVMICLVDAKKNIAVMLVNSKDTQANDIVLLPLSLKTKPRKSAL